MLKIRWGLFMKLFSKLTILSIVFVLPILSLQADINKAPATPKVTEQQYPKPAKTTNVASVSINIKEVFLASPTIYSSLLLMSMSAVVIWLYSILTFRVKDTMPISTISDLKLFLQQKKWSDALFYCNNNTCLLSNIIKAGILSRQHGPDFMVDRMKSEGQRLSSSHWQRISLLNDIVLIAPMLGLLGTVLGMFYAFYDSNRSVESISAVFDGLGVAVGTTVAGLIVAIISMVFATMIKHRLISTLSNVEKEAISLSNIITVEKEVL
jgi:biopolymer transport protein ExbB